MPETQDLIAIKNLEVALNSPRGPVYAVRDINMKVQPAEIHGIVGESGCGKTMTAKSIMRLNNEKTTLYQGNILFEGTDLLQLKAREMTRVRGKDIGMIFQDPMQALNPLRTVGSQIAEAMTIHGFDKQTAKARVIELLEAVGIHPPERRAKQYPFEMSGGQMQRVMIAMAIACSPKLLIADEPTTALDVTVQAQILELLVELQQSRNMSVLIITHNFGVIAEICHFVSVMYAGIIVESGKVGEIFHDPRHPYTRDLIASIPQSGPGMHERLISIPGAPPDLRQLIIGCPYAGRCRYTQQRCYEQKPEVRDASDSHRFTCLRDVAEFAEEDARVERSGSPASIDEVGPEGGVGDE
ncbi:MAG: ABC transporter ATP-binding protein [Actinomycetes bacterium]|jgi:oligopeptide/dipeptide ABC transporter ATP-binding protein|nr:ABC transporter ATP-binding protein [Actinomycetes bacterium]